MNYQERKIWKRERPHRNRMAEIVRAVSEEKPDNWAGKHREVMEERVDILV